MNFLNQKRENSWKRGVFGLILLVMGLCMEVVAAPTPLRWKVDQAHPLLIVPVYGESFDAATQTATLGNGDTFLSRWQSIPEDIRPYAMMEIHIGGIGMKNGREEIEAFFESQLTIAEKHQIPVVLVCVTAGQIDEYTAADKIDIQWVDRMYQTYSSLKGVMATENYWTDYYKAADDCADLLKVSAKHGGFFIWSEHVAYVLENILNYAPFLQMAQRYPENFIFTWKNTPANWGKCTTAASSSYMLGCWLGGLCSAWGGLMDSWKWWELGFTRPYQQPVVRDKDNRRIVCEPEAGFGCEMINIWANGGTVYSFEHPIYIHGAEGKNTPLFDQVIAETFRWIIRHPAPTKQEMIDRTQILLSSTEGRISSLCRDAHHPEEPDFFCDLLTENQTYPFYTTGRYGLIPAFPSCISRDQLRAIFGKDVQILTTLSKEARHAAQRTELFNTYYREEIPATSYATRFGNQLAAYNSHFDADGKQHVTFPLANGDSLFVEFDPFTFVLVSLDAKGGAEILVNNLMTSREELWSQPGDFMKEWTSKDLYQWITQRYIPQADASAKRDITLRLKRGSLRLKSGKVSLPNAPVNGTLREVERGTYCLSLNGSAILSLCQF